MSSIQILVQYREAFFQGLSVTLRLFAVACVLGSAIGVVIAAVHRAWPPVVRRLIDAFSFSIAAIPALVLLFWLHFPLQSLLGIIIDPFVTAAATLAIINAIGVSRSVIEGMNDFPRHYLQAAQVCGMDRWSTMRFIEIPILLRTVLPRWIDQQVVIFHGTIFASLISVEEVFRAAQRVNSVVYQPVAIYTAMALLFLVTAGAALFGARILRQRVTRDFSEK